MFCHSVLIPHTYTLYTLLSPLPLVFSYNRSALTSSCVICFDATFDREGFSDRTVLICDQCEREFHVSACEHAETASHTHKCTRSLP